MPSGCEASGRRSLLVDAHADSRVEKTFPNGHELTCRRIAEPSGAHSGKGKGKGTFNPCETAKVETRGLGSVFKSPWGR